MPVVPSENERVDAAVPLIDGLNPDQLDAVVHTDGPLLVVAGAGSGKTRVLTHRIAHLIGEHGVNPMRILAITFTNKAADEMRERVAALVGPVARKMWVSTFHSACVRILRREAGGHRLPVVVLHLRPGRRPAADRLRHPRPGPRPQAVHARRASTPRSASTRTTWSSPAERAGPGRQHLRAQDRRHLHRVPGPPGQGRGHGLRRPADQHRAPVPRAPRRPGAATRSASSTSWSTSTRTPTGPRTS